MNSKRLEQLLALAAKTGDRLIVYDSSGRLEPLVVMDVPSYQKLLAVQGAGEKGSDEVLPTPPPDTYEFEPILTDTENPR